MLLLPLALALALHAPLPQQSPPATAPRVAKPPVDPKSAIDAAVKQAAIDEIRVLINWSAPGDERAKRFSELRGLPELRPYFADEYRMVTVDVGAGDQNAELARQYGATIVAGALPALTVLDHSGKPLAQGSSSDFMSDQEPAAFDPKKLGAFLTKHKAPAPDATGPFEAAMSRAKRDGKSVFVWFSAPW